MQPESTSAMSHRADSPSNILMIFWIMTINRSRAKRFSSCPQPAPKPVSSSWIIGEWHWNFNSFLMHFFNEFMIGKHAPLNQPHFGIQIVIFLWYLHRPLDRKRQRICHNSWMSWRKFPTFISEIWISRDLHLEHRFTNGLKPTNSRRPICLHRCRIFCVLSFYRNTVDSIWTLTLSCKEVFMD